MELSPLPSPEPVFSRNPKEWRNVYLHYTTPAHIFPILEMGILSKNIADRARIPYIHTNLPKVQEAQGFEWISVWDSNKGERAFRETLSGPITIVTKTLPDRSQIPSAENAFKEEQIVKRRISLRNFAAVWLAEDFFQRKVGQVVSGIETKHLIPWINHLAQTSTEWETVITNQRTRIQENITASSYGQEMSESTLKAEVDERMAPRFVKYWLQNKFEMNVDESRVSDLVNRIKVHVPFPIYVITKSDTGNEALPLEEYNKSAQQPPNDFVWEMFKQSSWWHLELNNYNPNC